MRTALSFLALAAATLPALAQPGNPPSAPAARQPEPAAEMPTAEAIIAKYIEAIGGEEAIRAHRSRTDKGTMNMGGIKGDMTVYSAAPNKRVGLFVTTEMGTINQGYNGDQGWEISPQGKRLLDGPALADRARSSDFYQPLNLLKDHEVRVVGAETFNGAAAYRLGLRHKEAPDAEQFMIFDARSGLLIGRVTERKTAAGPIKLETAIADYKEFGGVRTPTRITTTVMGQEQVMTIDSVEYDNVPAEVFEVPKELTEGDK